VGGGITGAPILSLLIVFNMRRLYASIYTVFLRLQLAILYGADKQPT